MTLYACGTRVIEFRYAMLQTLFPRSGVWGLGLGHETKRRPPLPSADKPLLRLRGRSVPVDAACNNEYGNYFNINFHDA